MCSVCILSDARGFHFGFSHSWTTRVESQQWASVLWCLLMKCPFAWKIWSYESSQFGGCSDFRLHGVAIVSFEARKFYSCFPLKLLNHYSLYAWRLAKTWTCFLIITVAHHSSYRLPFAWRDETCSWSSFWSSLIVTMINAKYVVVESRYCEASRLLPSTLCLLMLTIFKVACD